MPIAEILASSTPMAEAWWQVFGRLHPLLLHFPIALILLGSLVALIRWCVGKGDQPSAVIQFCLWGGLVSCFLAAWAGWVFAEEPRYATYTLLDWHRWLSVGALGAMVLAAIFDCMRRSPRWHWALPARLLALLLAAALVTVSGHLGASMKWGSDFILMPLEKARAATDDTPPQVGDDAAAASSSATATDAPEPADATQSIESGDGQGAAQRDTHDDTDRTPEPQVPSEEVAAAPWGTVEGLLEGTCGRCHGPDSQKGGLQIVPWSALFADDEQFWVVAPGEPGSSLLLERISLPATSDDRMPPEGEGDMFNAAQLELVRAWIAAGAHGPANAAPPTQGAPPPPPSGSDQATSPDSGARSDPSKVLPGPFDQAAEDAQLKVMRERGIRVGPLHTGSPWLQVDMSRLDPPATDADCDGLAALAGNLWSCSMADAPINDAAMASVAPCVELRTLRLDGTGVTDAGIMVLAPLQNLEVLNCWNTTLTDACIDHIASLESLRAVYLGSTGVTASGLEALRKARPDLAVHGAATGPAEAATDAPA